VAFWDNMDEYRTILKKNDLEWKLLSRGWVKSAVSD